MTVSGCHHFPVSCVYDNSGDALAPEWPRLNLQMYGIEPPNQYWTMAIASWGQVTSSICIRNSLSCSDVSGQFPDLSQGLTVLELYLLTSLL